MIDFLLDTDTCIYLIKRQTTGASFGQLQVLDISQLGISTITLSELEYGSRKVRTQSKTSWPWLNSPPPWRSSLTATR